MSNICMLCISIRTSQSFYLIFANIFIYIFLIIIFSLPWQANERLNSDVLTCTGIQIQETDAAIF